MNFANFFEAFVVGIIMALGVNSVHKLFSFLHRNTKMKIIPSDYDFDEWNKFHVNEISAFCAGFTAYIVAEVVGMNSWYCVNRAVNLTLN